MDLFTEASNSFNNNKDAVKQSIEEKSSITWMGIITHASELEPVSIIKRNDGLIGLAFKYKELVEECDFSSNRHGEDVLNGMSRFYPSEILYGVYDQNGSVHLSKSRPSSIQSLCSDVNAMVITPYVHFRTKSDCDSTI